MTQANRELLEAAIIGYRIQAERMLAKVAEIEAELRGDSDPVIIARPKKKRKMSDEGRARISAATKARWKAYRKAKKAA